MANDDDNKADWYRVRTCSRVSSGVCEKCKREAFSSAWRNRKNFRRVFCSKCFEEVYEPEKAAERERQAAEAVAKRKSDLALALEGKLPGATISESGAVYGPPVDHGPLGVRREVLREPMFDTEAYRSKTEAHKSDKDAVAGPTLSFFSNFDKFIGKKEGDSHG